MAITATSAILQDGRRNAVVQLTGISDGSGQEIGEVKVDMNDLNPSPKSVKVNRIQYDVNGGDVKLSWDGDVDIDFAVLTGRNTLDYCKINGMVNSVEDPKSGNILLSTLGFELNSSYTIKLDLIKKY
jgi:hypothetical protein